MSLRLRTHFSDLKLARMSSGTYCIIRDLGPVKGGKGMKHHEVLVTFSFTALSASIRSACRPKGRKAGAQVGKSRMSETGLLETEARLDARPVIVDDERPAPTAAHKKVANAR